MKEKWLSSDKNFDSLLPEFARKHSFIHWTPIEIIETSLDWLKLDEKSRVLDVGSGAGKFCLVGGMRSKATFTGVEMRSDMIAVANKLKEKLGVDRVTFQKGDIRDTDFRNYTHVYYYNPFCENIAEFDRIDDQVTYNPDMFRVLEDYVIDQLAAMSIGTRVVTYCSETFPFPASYDLQDMLYDGKLALWVKMRD